ncbi:hypothetical protein Trco_003369 [Trichoderma cornu-damae]|uniref:Brl1/Brr6 domain-containing protein n=1 Tax=Trichoderma cornu-damae TaxID=654480 RepID=A0A9P8TT78_9HYPO|nr:hypothetical protein Trco_003369 [Trichoderma cornu-damae]
MERRTFEAPMEWEYQNTGPVDLTSPSPLKPSTQSNPFSAFGTPSKPPTRSFFTPQLAPRVTTWPCPKPPAPRTNPAPTEVSAFPNDTPESEHMIDATAGNNTTPTKIDKASRYKRGSPRKHASGRGEIRPLRESPRKELQVLRKRKRHNYDRDVGSVIRHLPRDWDGDASDSDMSLTSYRGASPSKKAPPPSPPPPPPSSSSFSSSSQQRAHQAAPTRPSGEGWFVSALGTMDRYPGAPDHIYRWLQLGLNCFIMGIVMFFGWSVVEAVRSDIRNANEMARMEIMSRITECQKPLHEQRMHQEGPAGAARAVRPMVTIKQVAEVINEFADAMNLKAWIMFGTIAVFVIFSNVLLGWGRSKGHPAPLHPTAFSHVPPMAPDATPAHFRARFETPRAQRYAFIEDDMTDADPSPPKMALGPGFAYTPSGRRSPSKGERPLSPIKYHRSPNKGY